MLKQFLMGSVVAGVMAFGIPTATAFAQQTTPPTTAEQDAKKAGKETKSAGKQAGEATKDAAKATGKEVKKGAKATAKGTEKAGQENQGRRDPRHDHGALQGRHDAEGQDQDDRLRQPRRRRREAVVRTAHRAPRTSRDGSASRRILGVMRTTRAASSPLSFPLFSSPTAARRLRRPSIPRCSAPCAGAASARPTPAAASTTSRSRACRDSPTRSTSRPPAAASSRAPIRARRGRRSSIASTR